MAFVKVLKTRSYFKRYQVQYRRRREGKTDYYARRRLIIQDRNKYNTPKYRMVVRFSNRDITAQIVSAHLEGDRVLCAAYAHELSKYGLPKDVGVTNYAAAYATGLLLARRSLATLQMADIYKGVAKADGKEYHPYGGDFDAGEKKNPFKVVLDVGLRRTTTGARIFGVLKGAVDGGLNIPHSDNRFPGNVDGKYNPEVHRQHIFGIHIGAYMEELKGDGEGGEEYHAQFSRYIKAKLETGKAFEAMYQKVHDTIRKTASGTAKDARKAKQAAKKAKHGKDTKSTVKKARLSCSQRHARAALKISKGVAWTHKVAKAPAAKPAAKGGKAAAKK